MYWKIIIIIYPKEIFQIIKVFGIHTFTSSRFSRDLRFSENIARIVLFYYIYFRITEILYEYPKYLFEVIIYMLSEKQ